MPGPVPRTPSRRARRRTPSPPRGRAAACRPSRALRARSRRAGSSGFSYRSIRVSDWKNQATRTTNQLQGRLVPWRRRSAPTATGAGSRGPSTSSASAGRCSSSASCCSGPSASPTCARGCPTSAPTSSPSACASSRPSGVLRRAHAAAARRLADLRAHRAGLQLEPVVLALGRFGSVAPFPPGEARIGVDAARHRPQDALRCRRRRRAERELRAPPRRAALPPARGRRPARGRARERSRARRDHRDRPGTLATVLWHGRALDEARRAGDLVVGGDRAAVTRLLGLFPLPS